MLTAYQDKNIKEIQKKLWLKIRENSTISFRTQYSRFNKKLNSIFYAWDTGLLSLMQ